LRSRSFSRISTLSEKLSAESSLRSSCLLIEPSQILLFELVPSWHQTMTFQNNPQTGRTHGLLFNELNDSGAIFCPAGAQGACNQMFQFIAGWQKLHWPSADHYVFVLDSPTMLLALRQDDEHVDIESCCWLEVQGRPNCPSNRILSNYSIRSASRVSFTIPI